MFLALKDIFWLYSFVIFSPAQGLVWSSDILYIFIRVSAVVGEVKELVNNLFE